MANATTVKTPLTFAEIIAKTSTTEIITWVLFCSLSTLLGFFLATYDYFKKTRSTPSAKRKMRAKKEMKQQMDEESKLTSISVEPIAISDYLSEWKLRQKKRTLQYEFKAIERRTGQIPKLAHTATKADNLIKNIGSILPYEHNMVHLSPTEDRKFPYVNASWIDGHQQRRKYIAAQGPNAAGVDEFFEMIWQLNIRCIVMLNQVFENGVERGIRYWRDGNNANVTYGKYKITTTGYFTTADFTIRYLDIENKGRVRHIKHYHVSNWSDINRTNIIGFLEIRRLLNNDMAQNNIPVVIHCNNGSGRTGAFICADINLDRIAAGKAIDIFGLTVNLRRSRCLMINTCSQYQFVYELIANYVTCGSTIVSIEDLSKTVQRLALKTSNKITGFEEELKNLNYFTVPITAGECAAGHREENRWKSRNIMLQPAERSRPYLHTTENANGTDYINAVYVDGNRSINQYIITQWPLKSTVNDVWRLIYDHHVSVVVVLNDMGKGTRTYPRFWPAVSRQSTGFGPVAVELVKEVELTSNIKCRVFQIRKLSNKLAYTSITESKEMMGSRRQAEPNRTVIMLQTTCWPNRHRVPESTSGLIQLIQAADDFYNELCPVEQRMAISPILVMSKDGVSRVGCFCVIHMSMIRMVTEKKADIFRATEVVKRNRPDLIDGISEFLLCYDSCLDFYNRFIRGENGGLITSSL